MNTRIHYVLRSYIMKYLLPLFLLMSVSACFHSLDASYEGEELIMTERDGSSHKYMYKKIYDLSAPLYSIYWNPSNNQYYYIKDGSDLIKTNGLTYKLDPKKEEEIFVSDIKDPYLQYAGYISPKERLYIDKRDNQQYIKVLTPIQDPIYVIPYKSTWDNKEWRVRYEDTPNQERFSREIKTGELSI